MTTDKKNSTTPDLSSEDQVVLERWRAEVGEARLRRIAAAVATRRAGRKSAETDRWHLLLMMARLHRAHPATAPYRLACMVVDSPEGRADKSRRPADPTSLNRWLCDGWKRHGQLLKREIAATEQRQSGLDMRQIFHSVGKINSHVGKLLTGPVPPQMQNLVAGIQLLQQSPTPPWLEAAMTAVRILQQNRIPPALQALLAAPAFAGAAPDVGLTGEAKEAARLLMSELEKTPPD